MNKAEIIKEKKQLQSISDSKDSTENSDDQSEMSLDAKPSNDPDNYLFPFCIVWTPLSLISVLFPFIGHTGICTSKGVIYDYAGSHFATESEISFNAPTKYVFLTVPFKLTKKWDATVTNINVNYNNKNYNLLFDNCHSYCAYVLNEMNYNGRSDYSMVDVFLMVTLKSKFISYYHYIKTYIGFIMLILMIIFLVYFSEF